MRGPNHRENSTTRSSRIKNLSPLNILLFILSISVFTACDDGSPASTVTQETEREPTIDAEDGKVLYDQICVLCHGPGAPPEADLTGVTNRIDYAEFNRVLSEGVAEMPAFDSIKETDRRNLWEFLKTHESK